MKKLLAVGVIVLFLGLAIAPSINANIGKASIEREIVEITTEICGINGVTPNTVSLSKEDAEEVEHLFDSIRERLNATETREETEKIFNEVVVELDKYGLLGGLSVEQAQRVVNGEYQNSRFTKLFERLFVRNQFLDNDSNYLCSVAGQTSSTHTGSLFLLLLIAAAIGMLSVPLTEFLAEFIERFVSTLIGVILSYGGVLPSKFTSLLYFGQHWWSDDGGGKCGANGWISTNGLNGIRNWEGNNLYGGVQNFVWYYCLFGLSGTTRWCGVAGFTGIITKISYENISFLGSALKVKLRTGCPYG